MVDRETTLTWEQLIALPMFEQYVTISCVSNEVGGKLVGNAKWTGVRLRDVLDIAGVQAAATQLVGRSSDGFTAGMPTAWVMDTAREPMIAVKMNDEPLPPAHGYPARLIVPGPVRLRLGDEVAHRARADDARGVRRLLGPARLVQGGADPDPVAHRHAARRRQRPARSMSPGSPGRPTGASRGSRSRSMGPGATPSCHARSRTRRGSSGCTDWAATPGSHVIQVRATDGTGAVQPEQPTPPAPDGARGWHTDQRVGQLTLPGGTDPRRSDRSGTHALARRPARPPAGTRRMRSPRRRTCSATESSAPRSRYSARSWTSRSKNCRLSYRVISFTDLRSRPTGGVRSISGCWS